MLRRELRKKQKKANFSWKSSQDPLGMSEQSSSGIFAA